jgi:ABC-type uncharacterized transport system permease subunit
MEVLVNASHVVLLVLYTLLVVAYAQTFARGTGGLARLSRKLLVGTVVVHLGSILIASAQIRACPLGRGAEFLSLMAFSIASIYLTIELRSKERALGIFAITPAFVLQVIAAIGILGSEAPPATRLGMEASIHAFAAIVGFASVALANVFGLLYLFLYLAIKRGRFGLFYRKISSLERLADLNREGLLTAFVALSVNVFVGVWERLRDPESTVSLTQPIVLLTLFVWVFYGACLVARRWFQLSSKRFAAATLIGIPFLIAVFVGELLSTGGFHG